MLQPPEPERELSIALDASLWDEPTTGIGLYTRRLAGALAQEGVRVRRMGARHSGENPRGESGRTAYFLARFSQVLAGVEEPLFHALSNFNLPPVRVPGKRFVLTVHDVIPELLPDAVSLAFRWQFRLWLSRSVHTADRIICISQKTSEDLARRFEVDEKKLSVVYLGVDHVDDVPEPDATGQAFIQSLALPQEYILYAGALDARKNIEALLAAVTRLRVGSKPATLVIVGQNWYGADAISTVIRRARAAGADIRSLGFQSEPVFYELMRRSTVFAFPSRYEGFGLPPLEAMRLGVPTVVSNAGALPEVCADAAVQVPPADVEGWTAALGALLQSPEARRARAAAGRERAARFTWRETARRTIEVYRSALA
jgi:glycosyltransferase involved in cell wall biosynthesis